MRVVRIEKSICRRWIEKKHYRKTLGVFWEGFGLIINGMIEGVACYGQPSAPIQKHAFNERGFRLYELTRLVIQTDKKNAGSFLIANSLKMLKENPSAVISYADSSMGHCGIIYQSTNWIYTGSTIAHDSLYLIDGEKVHPMTIKDRFGVTKIKEWADNNGIERIKPEPKHRYFYLLGNKREKRIMIKKMKYKIIKEYPKSNKTLYDAGDKIIEPIEEYLF